MAYGPHTDILLKGMAQCKHNWYEFWKSDRLYISGLDITRLPVLPKYIKKISCSYSTIQEIPELPEGLEQLICARSNISNLPELPKSLKTLACYDLNNPITIPKLPEGLERLRCDGAISAHGACLLKWTLSLKEFIENNENRVQLPDLPKSLKWLACDVIRPDDMSMETFIDTIRDWQELPRSKKRSQERCKIIKEELMMSAWHPRRVEKWLEAGGFELLEAL
jgi:hypothetical protein